MYVLVKVVRAKHTGPWEGGGIGMAMVSYPNHTKIQTLNP